MTIIAFGWQLRYYSRAPAFIHSSLKMPSVEHFRLLPRAVLLSLRISKYIGRVLMHNTLQIDKPRVS